MRLRPPSTVAGFVQLENKNVEENEMKTMVAFSMALATLALATTADADAQDRRCKPARGLIGVRAEMPCVFFPLRWGGFLHVTGIIEPPHNGAAVLRADGSIYYSPKPGFTGRDGMRVQVSCDVPVKLQEMASFCRAPSPGAVAIFVE
jgi:hypothetical protein